MLKILMKIGIKFMKWINNESKQKKYNYKKIK